MSGKITFVGAGPGAPDLVTVRGAARLAEADLVLYAGSLVSERLLELAPRAECISSADLDLAAMVELMCAACKSGKKVVRLHTGDPSLYGATAEQYRALERAGIEFEVVPGVSSVLAAAAELKCELTAPEVAQTVVITRIDGRTPMPAGEELERLPGGTLTFFLSASGAAELSRRLIAAGRAAETPAAAVYRASWADQKVIRGTLGDIAERMSAAGIKRQALIIVGEALASSGAESRLYAAGFSHGYRGERFGGSAAIFALTAKAAAKAAEIAAGLNANARVLVPQRFTECVPECRREVFADFSTAFSEAWEQFDALIFVGAMGIAVRHAAPLLRSKATDPAVVVCDERGDYSVSLLSGHLGGANALARQVAGVTGGRAVITTASDVGGLTAFDEFARIAGYRLIESEKLVKFSAALVAGGRFTLRMPRELFERFYVGNQFKFGGDAVDNVQIESEEGDILNLVRNKVVVGVGCRFGVAAEDMERAVEAALAMVDRDWRRVDAIATAEIKKAERAVLFIVQKYEKALYSYSKEELNLVAVPNPSPVAKARLGINSVAEAAALLGAGAGARLLLEKSKFGNITVAIAVGEGDE